MQGIRNSLTSLFTLYLDIHENRNESNLKNRCLVADINVIHANVMTLTVITYSD